MSKKNQIAAFVGVMLQIREVSRSGWKQETRCKPLPKMVSSMAETRTHRKSLPAGCRGRHPRIVLERRPALRARIAGPNVSIHSARRRPMPQSTHNRLAELHNLAAHYHTAAATAHGKGDHRTAHELSRQAHEHSVNAHRLADELAGAREETGRTTSADAVAANPSDASIESKGV